MKGNAMPVSMIGLMLALCAAEVSALACSIVTPDIKEIPQGEYLLLAAVVDERGCEGEAAYEWRSNVDGFLDSGASTKINNLSVGRHVLEFRYSDSCGRSCSTSMPINVKEVRLGVYIDSPKHSESYRREMDVLFRCVVSGGKPPYTYLWRLDGEQLSNKDTFTQDLPSGSYKAELAVRDSLGKEARDEASFYVKKEGVSVSIDSPGQYQTIAKEESVNFSATASGGEGPYSYKWVFGGRVLSETREFSLNNISEYVNDSYTGFSVKVTDSSGKAASAEVFIRKDPICTINGVCHGKENFNNCPGDCLSGSQDGLCDKISEGICDPDCRIGEDVDCVCDGDGVCDLGREDSIMCPLECSRSSFDGVCDPISDGACDPDCRSQRDPDCFGSAWLSYLLIIILLGLVFTAYALIRKRAA